MVTSGGAAILPIGCDELCKIEMLDKEERTECDPLIFVLFVDLLSFELEKPPSGFSL